MSVSRQFLATALVVVAFAQSAPTWADTYYMAPGDATGDGSAAAPWTNLSQAFSAMKSGDRLVIRDGTYTGVDNQIRYNNAPPRGAPGAYTVIAAETAGDAVFDGQGQRSMFDGGGTFRDLAYVRFEGLLFVNSSGGHDLTGVAHDDRTAHHIKFLTCGFEDNVTVSYASYVLFEDCYVWGSGRYSFGTFTVDHVVFRRCVARLDRGNGGGMPISHFVNYTSEAIAFQNCIAIDSDDDAYSNYEGVYGGFYVRTSNQIESTRYVSRDTRVRGSMVLNVRHDTWGRSSFSVSLALGGDAENTTITDSIWWDVGGGMGLDNGPLEQDYTVDHCTFGRVLGMTDGSADAALVGYSGLLGQASNSLFYDIAGDGLDSLRASVNNAFFQIGGSATSGVVDEQGSVNDVDPLWQSTARPGGGLKHLPRIETEGAFATAGDDGQDLGAQMTARVGQPATLWGEPGWDGVTNQALWPWPHEALIQRAFRTGVANPPSNRGFCADGDGLYGGPVTLTSYVWEYLGHACPAKICDDAPSPGDDAGIADAGSDATSGGGGTPIGGGGTLPRKSGCSCNTAPSPGAWWLVALLVWLTLRRRNPILRVMPFGALRRADARGPHCHSSARRDL